jgi:hypothetical protein
MNEPRIDDRGRVDRRTLLRRLIGAAGFAAAGLSAKR